MIRPGYPCGDTVEEVFDYFHIGEKRGAYLLGYLISEGYSKKGICYGAGQKRDNLLKYVSEPARFDSIFINAVRQYATNWRDKSQSESALQHMSRKNKGEQNGRD